LRRALNIQRAACDTSCDMRHMSITHPTHRLTCPRAAHAVALCRTRHTPGATCRRNIVPVKECGTQYVCEPQAIRWTTFGCSSKHGTTMLDSRRKHGCRSACVHACRRAPGRPKIQRRSFGRPARRMRCGTARPVAKFALFATR
jgi:hypothetical protein